MWYNTNMAVRGRLFSFAQKGPDDTGTIDLSAKEAVPIESNEHRNIRRPDGAGTSGAHSAGGGQGRKLNRSDAAHGGAAPGRGASARTGGKNGPSRISSSPRRATRPAGQPAGEEGGERRPRNGKKQPRALRIFKGFMKFIAACICLGVMVGSVLAVLLSLYAVEITANDAELLDLNNLELAQTSQLLARDHDTGEWVVTEEWHDSNDREWVDLQEIETNPYLKWAFICVEDKDFYEHSGVNFKRTIAATINYVATKLGFPIYDSMQGASTLDQQLIKNILGDDDVSVDRKLREIFRALGLDKRYDKDTILEAYLNTVSLSGSIAGVKAGASNYFNVENLADLSPAECASIAAITKNPTGYNPYTNPEQHLQRRNWILQLMHEQGKLTDSEYNEAVSSPLVLAEEKEADVITTSSNNSYFADAVYKMLLQQLQDELGYTAAEAHNLIYNGGLRIYTTMDPYIQEEMEKIMLNADDAIPALWHEEEVLQSQVPDPAELENIVVNDDGTYKTGTNDDGEPVYYYNARTQSAMLTMDYSGQVLALVGGLGEKTTDLGLNRAVAPEYGGTQRSVGSTMKPLAAYSLGIDSGLIHYSSALPDLGVGKIVKTMLRPSYPQYGAQMYENDAPEVLANPDIWQDWPTNYEGPGDGALVTVNTAIARSKNTIAVRVGQRVGKDYMYSFARDTLGMTHLTEADADYAPMVLGSFSKGISLMELTGAYQMFGNGHPPPVHHRGERRHRRGHSGQHRQRGAHPGHQAQHRHDHEPAASGRAGPQRHRRHHHHARRRDGSRRQDRHHHRQPRFHLRGPDPLLRHRRVVGLRPAL